MLILVISIESIPYSACRNAGLLKFSRIFQQLSMEREGAWKDRKFMISEVEDEYDVKSSACKYLPFCYFSYLVNLLSNRFAIVLNCTPPIAIRRGLDDLSEMSILIGLRLSNLHVTLVKHSSITDWNMRCIADISPLDRDTLFPRCKCMCLIRFPLPIESHPRATAFLSFIAELQ